jgi:indole-3-glycerol phosphate synthase
MTVLDEIIAHKRVEVAELRASVPLAAVRAQAQAAPPGRDFAAAITGPPVRIIAEIKRASPSAGRIRDDADPTAVAGLYERAGAAAISVLTDRRYFSGSLDDLRAVAAAVRLPVLRKDFTIDPYQVYEARAAGADAILLIAGTLSVSTLTALGDLAAQLGLAAIVEVHTEEDLDDAVAAGARLIGINNRDLRTLAVDLNVTRRLRPRIPRGVVVVSESGIETAGDVRRVCAAGIHAILVGTTLMASADPAAHLTMLRHAAETAAPAGAAQIRTGGRHP